MTPQRTRGLISALAKVPNHQTAINKLTLQFFKDKNLSALPRSGGNRMLQRNNPLIYQNSLHRAPTKFPQVERVLYRLLVKNPIGILFVNDSS